MAKSKNNDLMETLRAHGLRKRVAASVSDALDSGRRRSKPPKQVRKVVEDLKHVVEEIEDRATGGPAKRSAAARKAAATRKRNARARSAAAKKGARTRAARSG